jgi:sugar lactone lactonase YvrE
MEFHAELVVDAQCTLGEGPVWDDRERRLLWVDIDGKKLHAYDPARNDHRVVPLKERIGCFILSDGGRSLAAGEHGFYRLDIGTGRLERVTDPEAHVPHTRFNDGKADPRGRFYAGTASSRDLPEGAFYVFDPGPGTVRKLLDGVACSNGIAWSPDLKTMYYIDSMKQTVDAFDYDVDTGEIANRRTVIRYEEPSVLPDGMTWDAEGMLWVAEWGGCRVSRWNPATAERIAVVHVPSRYVTSCVFGGEELDELYITTARQTDREHPHAGGLFKAKVGVKGTVGYRYRD